MAEDFEHRRRHMVASQVAARGIRGEALLDAMRAVPRERFVDPRLAGFAYEDSPLPIGEEQTISQPYIVAAMIEAAEVRPGDRVLEVGAGSGYAAAILAQIAARVIAIERHPTLGEAAAERMRALGYANVEVRVGDGTTGAADDAPFDAIIVSAGGPLVPESLKRQLAIGGRLIIPVGAGNQKLTKVTCRAGGRFEEEDLGAVAFVPLIGMEGWAEHGRRVANPPRATRRSPS